MNKPRANRSKSDQMQLLVEKMLLAKLGGLADLSEVVQDLVRELYRAFVPIYVEIVRIKDGQPSDWVPDALSFDPEIMEDMRHFFSDYQHIVNEFIRVNQKIETLRASLRQARPSGRRCRAGGRHLCHGFSG